MREGGPRPTCCQTVLPITQSGRKNAGNFFPRYSAATTFVFVWRKEAPSPADRSIRTGQKTRRNYIVECPKRTPKRCRRPTMRVTTAIVSCSGRRPPPPLTAASEHLRKAEETTTCNSARGCPTATSSAPHSGRWQPPPLLASEERLNTGIQRQLEKKRK